MTDPTDPDTPPGPEPLRPASPVRRQARRAALAGISLIWAVPALALVVTLALAWNAYSGRGELVSVAFSDATGVTPGQTEVKFREITVGRVEAVRFTPDLNQVVLELRVDEDIARYIDESARFWVVRPQVSARGISRLDTVLTGVFVEGDWDANVGPGPEGVIQGLDRAPLVRRNEVGTWVVLASEDAGGVSEGAPVMYRGLPVGRMENLRLSDRDEGVLADVFVAAPHDQRLTTATVFWDTSGLSLSLGAQGLSLNVNSLASLLQGGVQFETLSSGGQPVQAGHVFRLQPDEDAARASLFTGDEENELRLTLLVDSAVRGLAKGADVQFQGLTVGRVTDLKVRVVPGEEGRARQVLQDVTIAVSPVRFGLPEDATPEVALAFLSERVAEGLRARLASAGFLGTALMIELVPVPDAEPARIIEAEPFPILPTVESDIADLTTTAQGFIGKISGLPLEETLRAFQDAANSITALASSEDTRALPRNLGATLEEAQAALEEVHGFAADLRASGTAEKIASMLDEAEAAAQAVREAAVDVPEMVADMDAAAEAVAEVDFASIGAEAQAILQDLRAMLGSEDAEQLPRNLSDTLQAASALLTDLREGGAVGNLNDALASGSAAADEVAAAVQRLPQLTQRYEQLAARAEAVIAAYGDRSPFNTEAVDMLRELRRATAAFGSLARTIERNPRAFILGR